MKELTDRQRSLQELNTHPMKFVDIKPSTRVRPAKPINWSAIAWAVTRVAFVMFVAVSIYYNRGSL